MLYKVTFRMSEGGRSNRDQHSLVFLGQVDGSFNRANARDHANAVALVLADVLFSRTHIMRAVYTPVENNGKSTGGANITVPLDKQGRVLFAEDDGASRDEIVLAVAKSSDDGRTGTSLLRHVLSAKEEAAYVLAKTRPARFNALTAASGQEGEAFGPALLAAFNSNGLDMMLPPKPGTLTWTQRPVVDCEAQDFRIVQVTKRKQTLEAIQAKAAETEMAKFAKAAWKIFRAAVRLGTVAEIVVTVGELVLASNAVYNALPPLVRALVNKPTFPELPSPA